MIEIHEVKPEEFEEAGRITASAWQRWDGADPEAWETFRQHIADVASRAQVGSVFVASKNRQILGSVTLELTERLPDEDNPGPLAKDEAHVRLLGVAPAARRRGVGRLLMEHCISVARAHGKHRLTVNTGDRNVAAQALYEGMGFVRGSDTGRPNGLIIRSYQLTL